MILLVGLGCPRNEPMAPIKEGDGSLSQLSSSVNVADPRSDAQLLKGFYPLEQGSWRWTEKEFSVILAVPAAVPGHQSSLDVHVTLPSSLEALLPITLSVDVEDIEAGSQVFDEIVSDHLVTLPVPESALTEDDALVEFKLDKAIGPRESDTRELGVVVTSIAIK